MKNLFAALVVTASMTAFASEPVKAEAKPEAAPGAAVKAEAKPEVAPGAAVKAEAKPEMKAETTPAPVKAEAKPEKTTPVKKAKKVAAETK